jgi:hypothetical protein
MMTETKLQSWPEFLASGTWWISRDGGSDINGEWQPAGSWSGYRNLNNAISYHIRIYGRKVKGSFGLKPKGWCAELRHNGGRAFKVESTHKSCKSIKDALYYADRELTEVVFQQACKWFFDVDSIQCVVKADGNTPFFTSFGTMRFYHFTYLGNGGPLVPLGKYKTAEWKRRWDSKADKIVKDGIRFSSTEVGYWGTGGGMLNDNEFEHWLQGEDNHDPLPDLQN